MVYAAAVAVYLHRFYIFLAQSYVCYLASLHAHWEVALGVRLPRIIVKTSSLNDRHSRWNRSAKIGKSNTEELSPPASVLKILYRSWQLHLIFLILVNFTSSAHHASPASHFYPGAHTYPDTRRRLPMHLSRHFPPLLCSGVSTRQFVPTVIHGTFYRPRTNSVLCKFSGEDMHLRLYTSHHRFQVSLGYRISA